MGPDAIRSVGSLDPRQIYRTGQTSPEGTSFADSLQKALADVNDLQTRRDDMVQQMVSGQVSEVHDVMMAAEEAQLAFELLLEVRNRLLEAYQELMRMQV